MRSGNFCLQSEIMSVLLLVLRRRLVGGITCERQTPPRLILLLQHRDTAERRRHCFIEMIFLNDGVTLLLAITESYVSKVLQFDRKRSVGTTIFAQNLKSRGRKSSVEVTINRTLPNNL